MIEAITLFSKITDQGTVLVQSIVLKSEIRHSTRLIHIFNLVIMLSDFEEFLRYRKIVVPIHHKYNSILGSSIKASTFENCLKMFQALIYLITGDMYHSKRQSESI